MTVEAGRKRTFRKVLVANRGEIAVRVIRALREEGILSAVIYSDPDRRGLPVLLADEAYRIGPGPSRESYLRAEAIVELAQQIGADALHPGYGFLAENADFARLSTEAGVTFIGPPARAIAAMGSKIESRRLMREAGVPVVPGGDETLPDPEAAEAFARQIGYPVMVKAAAGGGGRGLRLVRTAEQLPAAYRAARSEARASFGDDSVYLEKYLERPRHVEIQVLADEHGRVVSLGERECSLQRRHQKVVEEAPSPAVSPELRRRLGEEAVRAARAVGYTNAGTVEFLLDTEGRFYFLEMNTRLQVEHPVTEMVTGLDLVRAQLHLAQGGALDPALEGVEPNGHAIEVRLYAEDPFHAFAPSPGRIERLRWPEGPGVRNDSGVYEGWEVPIHYDPMLAKLIVWGRDREQALARLGRALAETRIDGIRSTVPLFRALLEDEDFLAGRLDSEMLDRKLDSGELVTAVWPDGPEIVVIAAALEHLEYRTRSSASPGVGGGRRGYWRQAARRESLRGSRWS
ncbi:MAG: acetyl-CoA carboxylase biotin carboxylase subunit [Thermoanaerobaculia bacterium]